MRDLIVKIVNDKGLLSKRTLYNVNGHIGQLTETMYEHINMEKRGKKSGWYPCLALMELGTDKWLYSDHWKLSEANKAHKTFRELGYPVLPKNTLLAVTSMEPDLYLSKFVNHYPKYVKQFFDEIVLINSSLAQYEQRELISEQIEYLGAFRKPINVYVDIYGMSVQALVEIGYRCGLCNYFVKPVVCIAGNVFPME